MDLTTSLVYAGPRRPSPIRGFSYGGWDPNREKFLIFAGADFADFDLAHNDTWEWDRATNIWTERQPIKPASLTERGGGGFAYDTNRKRWVINGGFGPGPAFDVFDQTFEFDPAGAAGAGQWIEVFPATVPAPRFQSHMSFDPVRNVVVMFAGVKFDPGFERTNELWEYDGTDWTLQVPITTGIYETPPLARAFHSIAYDPLRQLTVVIGGFNGAFQEVWLWDGIGWRQQTVGTEQPAADHMVGGGATFSSSDGMVIFHTGAANFSAPIASEIWGLNENGWRRFFPIPPPKTKGDIANLIGADESRVYIYDVVQRLGPIVGGTLEITNELWEFDGLSYLERRTGFEFDDTKIEVDNGARLVDQP